MTRHPLRRIEEDGTRVYSNYHRYKPKDPSERKYGVNKPDDPRAVRFGAVWLLPLPLIPDRRRKMPETRPDEDAYEHMGVNIMCMCDVCKRPAAERWRRKWRRDNGFTPGSRPRGRAAPRP